MGRRPRQKAANGGAPRSSRRGRQPAAPIDFAAEATRNPLYAGIAEIANARQLIDRLNQRAISQYDSETSMRAVYDLAYTGAVIERGLALGIIVERDGERSIDAFIANRDNGIKVTPSYVRMGRRFYRAERDGSMRRAIDWYKHEDGRRNTTRFRYVVQQPSGVIFVRDCLKGFTRYNLAIDRDKMSEADARAAVDAAFPPPTERPMPTGLTTAQRRDIVEALFISLVAGATLSGASFPVLNAYREQWATPNAFRNWLNEHGPASADETTWMSNVLSFADTAWGDIGGVNPYRQAPPPTPTVRASRRVRTGDVTIQQLYRSLRSAQRARDALGEGSVRKEPGRNVWRIIRPSQGRGQARGAS